MVQCWAAFLQPWRGNSVSRSEYVKFVQRHYVFYRGLLVLLVKRLSVTNMEGKELVEILKIVREVFCDDVVNELRKCDQVLKRMGKETGAKEGMGERGALIMEGFQVRDGNRADFVTFENGSDYGHSGEYERERDDPGAADARRGVAVLAAARQKRG